MSIARSQYNVFQQLTSARVVSASNLSGSYLNGVLNNGVGATLTANSAAALVIDGVTLEDNDRVLLAAQTNANENGVYVVDSAGSVSEIWVLIRSSDQQNIEQMKAGQFLSINAGTANAGSMYVMVEPLPAQLGIDDLNFESTQSPGGGDVTFSDVTVTDILTVANEGLHILDTNASHDLVVKAGSNLTADRILTLTTGDAARNLTLGSDVSLNQSLQIADSPVFAGVTLGNSGLHVLDTDDSHDLVITPGSNLTADRIFTLTTGDSARTLDISAANVTVSSYGATLVDDATNLAAIATLGIKSGDTPLWGGGATSNAFSVPGLLATDRVWADIISSTNAVAVAKVAATADTLTVTFTADPGAGTALNWLAIPTV